MRALWREDELIPCVLHALVAKTSTKTLRASLQKCTSIHLEWNMLHQGRFDCFSGCIVVYDRPIFGTLVEILVFVQSDSTT